MRIYDAEKRILNDFFKNLERREKAVWTKYLEIAGHVVRVVNYSPEFTKLFNDQLPFVLRDKADQYETTVILWKNNGTKEIIEKFYADNFKSGFKAIPDGSLEIFENDFARTIVNVNEFNNSQIIARDSARNVYYYSVRNLDMEEFRKQGHLLVKVLYQIFQNIPQASLVHGAAVGADRKGVLICARGGGGKSTLTVSTLLEKDFEYVSDDYLILSRRGKEVYSHPIYSVITLSPEMRKKLSRLRAEFVYDNWNKTKHILNISQYHDKFVGELPIRVCMFPHIIKGEKPTIEPMAKGKAIAQMVDSTIMQLGSKGDFPQTQKLLSFLRDFDFYKINLSQNLKANVDILKKFI
ncbi:MAG: hypothetical protein LBB09_03080, partial [Rickettsiales bacterium]|nr:hypothetical protein [Rickettsiales bacterium]